MQRHNIPICVEIWRINDSLLRFLKAGNESQRWDEQQHAGFWSQARKCLTKDIAAEINKYLHYSWNSRDSFWPVNPVIR